MSTATNYPETYFNNQFRLDNSFDQATTEFSHEDGWVLGSHDIVGSTFYIAMNVMLACTAFFALERDAVPKQWKKSVTVAMMVTGIAFWNYIFMKTTWVKTQGAPTVYRYTDWLVTVPLQIVEFYLILQASTRVSSGLFWKLLICSIIMLVGGYCGEVGACSVLAGFIVGMAGWLYIVYEIFAGEAGATSGSSSNKAAQQAFNTLRLIVSVGWIIYPVGYYLVYLVDPGTYAAYAYGYKSQSVLNCVYNLADVVNKGAFGLAIWAAGKADTNNRLM